MITPPSLQKGDTIAIVATARKITTQELQPFLALLSQWGLSYVLGSTINAEDHQFAGSDALRTKDLQKYLDDPKIKAIWCARGGYGTVRIIDALDFSAFRKNPKWIIGYSDVTVLHSHLNGFGIETLHADMPLELTLKSEATRTTVHEALFGKKYVIEAASEKRNRHGTAEGELVGGNLSILYSLLGSPSDIQTDGKILVIEDLDEMLYHIDRMLQNLKRNGLLKNLKGLIVGGMNAMRDNTIPFGKTAEEIILDAVSDYNYPVCFNFPVGHVPDNRALILGRNAKLQITNTSITLDFFH
ncbi:S66 peptidase family protein [Ulvibacter litoralis]|uniref:Muramoyltetrapeptide carboxypeptidase n=1 Tax=Ulvibacter litoralis TaxID=227084 RepID=A0A1G7DKM8_9FLAO|nr:LD-carboxypeptidase [Ulvibacter litoralis]GHC43221.1 peptidase S66 [Ulvibacter litoralis]SDE51610.1 muramoyltetrapeptide carboxypeptidase [Ulvibacter litoralis]